MFVTTVSSIVLRHAACLARCDLQLCALEAAALAREELIASLQAECRTIALLDAHGLRQFA